LGRPFAAKPRCATILFSVCLLLTQLSAQQDAPQRLAARALGPTPMLDDLRELCDGIGGRPTGSAACDRSVEWAARKFREAGISKVSMESFEVPSLWLPVSAEASAIAPESFSIRIAAAPFSPSTRGTLEAALVDAGDPLRRPSPKLPPR
jgi:hypothetical protein